MSKVFIKTASAVAWADAKRGMPIANIKANEKQPIPGLRAN
jgi:hypothetical protein